jgi:hypothetical protein
MIDVHASALTQTSIVFVFFSFLLHIMATDAFMTLMSQALSDVQLAQVRNLGADLQFVLNEAEVPPRLQHRLGELGYTTLQLLSVIGDDKASVRLFCKEQIPLNPAEQNLAPDKKAGAMLHTAQILASWQVASHRVTESEKIAAESRSQRLPVLLPKVTLVNLRRRYEATHGRILDAVFLCATSVEKVMEELEEGSWSALPLTDLISVEKSTDHLSFTEISSSAGAVKVRKAPKALPPPRNTEELRARMTTLAVLLGIAGLKHSTRLWLKTSTPELWHTYVEHTLGEKVANYHTHIQGAEQKPSWEIVLNYEYQIRKAACKKVLYEDLDLATALQQAMVDLEVKERYFITPLAVSAAFAAQGSSTGPNRSQSSQWREEAPARSSNMSAGSPKGKKGDGKCKSKVRKEDFKKAAKDRRQQGKNLKTPDGRLICLGFQQQTCKYASNCRYVHVCGKCHASDHGSNSCNK